MKIAIYKMVALMIAIVFLYSCGDGKTDSGSAGGGGQLTACAVNQILSNGICTACAINEVTVDNRCVACASSEINVNNMCMACSANEISVNNMCMACGINEVIENNSCVACGVDQQVVNGFCENIVVASPTAPTPGPGPVLTCPANSTLSGSICLCASNYRATNAGVGTIGTSCTIYPGDAVHNPLGGDQAPGSCANCHSVQVGTL